MKLKVGQLTLIGASVAGKCTAICIPQLNLTFDLGYLPEEAVTTDFILISHGHQDHLSALCLHQRQRRLRKLSKPTYLLPQVCHEPFKVWFATQLNLDTGEPDFQALEPEDLPNHLNLKTAEDYMNPNQPLKLKGKYLLTTFPTHHRVSSLGYLITEKRKKLKKEYQHLEPRAFGQLITSTPKEERSKFFNITDVHLVAYTGDTIFEPLTDRRANPMASQILEAEILIVECTYLQDKSKEKAHDYGHTHIEDILDAQEQGLLKCQHLVLFHFSNSYFDYRPKDRPTMIEELLTELNFRERMKPIEVHLFDRPPF